MLTQVRQVIRSKSWDMNIHLKSQVVPILGSMLVLLSALAGAVAVQAQTTVSWSEPVRLSEESAVLQSNTIAADPWGGVHVFWVQNEEADVTTGQPTNYIYYTGWDGEAWSAPHDLFAGPDFISYRFPHAVVDSGGDLHLVWAGTDGIYYSVVPAQDAFDAKTWRKPEILVRGQLLTHPRLAVDSLGALHVVYASTQPGSNVMYMRSSDDGFSWTTPLPVSTILPADSQAPDFTRIAVDSNDGIHVVWTENYPPEWIGHQVFYSRSTDGGETWTEPLPLSDLSTYPDWTGNIDITIDSADNLHVIHICGRAGRCYRVSGDGGETWSASRSPFEGLIGVSGWDAWASDSYGNVYWLGALREPQAVYFAALDEEGQWSRPQPLMTPAQNQDLGGAHFFSMTVGQGNAIHGAMVAGDKGPVWYIGGLTGEPAILASLPPRQPPQPVPTPTTVLTEAATSPTATVTAPESMASPPPSENALTDNALLWSVGAVLLFLVTVVAAKGFARVR